MRTMIRFPLRAGALAVAAALAACGGSTNQTSQTPTPPPTPATLSGTVQLGAVNGATVSVLPVNADGSIGAGALASTTTDATGAFTLAMPAQWPVVVAATGGTYTDLATGSSNSLAAQTVRAVLTAAPSGTLVVSPYSSAVVQSALAAGGLNTANVASASALIGGFIGGADPQSTVPDYGASATAAADGAAPSTAQLMAFALGAESEFRSLFDPLVTDSVSAIVAEAGQGSSLAACNAGAGNPNASGTLDAPLPASCMMPLAAAQFAVSANNLGPIKSANYATTDTVRGQVQTPQAADAAACVDPLGLLDANGTSIMSNRANEMQAAIGRGVTVANWKGFPGSNDKTVFGIYGPPAANYASIATPAACAATPLDFQRAWVVANETYWVDQGINYCHHHVPGWLPPADSTYYRVALLGNHTSGGDSSGMTCAATRLIDGSQLAPSVTTKPDDSQIQWQGVDCSNFTAWIYNVSGLTGNQLSGAIGTQACEASQPGVLIDIDAKNVFAGSATTDEALANPAAKLRYLQTGDLLYILSVAPEKSDASKYSLNHVVTWTGKRLSEFANGPDGAKYQIETAGQAGSRLAADFMSYYGKQTPAQVRAYDPFLIIDSHYAGPAYRPFTGWYHESLSHIRRIVGAERAQQEAALKPLLITEIARRKNGVVVLGIPGSTTTSGYRLTNQTLPGGDSCYQQR
ncbi:hypothetical protein [Chitinasiproducens palmae]|uniref:Lipoprotein n=1 Tax=Chitinasiproducens palmae TaxID=1770053 RepID=A0A1H2PKV7_9BURK|nr:hypothetical protein [Chitinasiproducens palmae]SDV46598.1 hypothetical protein SAMN05216551_101470 [Chitinasiproducens palmae]